MGYLDSYGRERPLYPRLVKAVGYALLAGIVGYCFYWLFFRNWVEEREAKRFLTAVEEGRYEEAYTYWGCTVEDPCKFYRYDEFLEDWGPDSPLGDVKSFELGRSWTQPGGVILEVTINGRKQPNLWIESDTKHVSFFPY